MPSYTANIILGIVSLAIVITGFVVIGMKVRWYSWVSPLLRSFFPLASWIFKLPVVKSDT